MKVDLRALKPNPTRDLRVDPVTANPNLEKSIEEHKLWPGIIAAKVNGEIVTVAGHSRALAGIEKGYTSADVFMLDDVTPEQMLAIYITENSTQRGNDSSALSGAVAGIVKLLAKSVVGNPTTGRADGSGGRPDIGWRQVHEWLTTFAPASGIKKNVIIQQLANLKASGDYGRIVSEVAAEVEAERIAAEHEAEAKAKQAAKEATAKAKREAEDAERRAEDARKKSVRANKAKDAAPQDRTFDLEGVQKYLKDPSHVETFRECVTTKNLAKHLPVDKQADVARRLIELAKLPAAEGGRAEKGGNITSEFIETKTYVLALDLRTAKNRLTKEEQRRLEREDALKRVGKLQHHFARQIASARGDLDRLLEIEKKYLKPKHQSLMPSPEFRDAMRWVRSIVKKADSAGL